ncbi:MAG: DUF3108 domain-containing protein [Planctomycetota bacterium]|nr:DUF3108 domain-containing protein [Planctomycetota bacterium]
MNPAVLAALSIALALIPIQSSTDPKPDTPYPIGETLLYEARLWKGDEILGGKIGEVKLTCEETTLASKSRIRFSATASGSAFGYKVVHEMESILDPETGRPIVHTSEQKGTAISLKRIDFSPTAAEYWKMKHCKDYGGPCKDDHAAYGDPTNGHCEDRHCGRMEHRHWSLRDTIPVTGPTYDPLSAVLFGRRSELSLQKRSLRVVTLVDDRLWEITIRVQDGGEVEVPAGIFDCLLLHLDPKILNPKPWKKDEKFEGPFGLQGDIRVWLDKEKLRPIKVRGRVPLGLIMDAEVRLTEIRQASSGGGDVKKEAPEADKTPGRGSKP